MDLSKLLELARMEARRRHHDRVAPEHLLAAILDQSLVSQALQRRGLDPHELRERLEARLAVQPVVGGYRDAGEVPSSATFERVVERLSERRWIAIGPQPTVLDVLLLEPWIASLVVSLRSGRGWEHVIERAVALAIVRGHASVGVGHVLAVLLDLSSFAALVEEAGGDLALLRSVVEQRIDVPSRGSDVRVRPTLSRSVERAIAPSSNVQTIRQLCIQLARQPETEVLFAAAGLDGSAFIESIRHGEPPPDVEPSVEERSPMEVVFNYDDEA